MKEIKAVIQPARLARLREVCHTRLPGDGIIWLTQVEELHLIRDTPA